MTSTPSTASTPRQPMKSPIRPETDAPSRFPVIEPISVRPIAIWRFSGPTRSLVRLSATGNTPPEPMPARIRDANSSQNEVAIAPRILATPSSTRHTIISRALPNRSAAAPSTGWMIAKVKANTAAKPAAVAMLIAEIVGDMRQHRIERARRQAGRKRRERNDIERRRQTARTRSRRYPRHQRAALRCTRLLASASNPIRVLTSASNSRSGTMLGPSDGA